MLTQRNKANIQFFTGIAITFIGILLLFTGLVMPPMGIIDWSVLTAFGEIATFSGALIGIDYTYKIKSLNMNGINYYDQDEKVSKNKSEQKQHKSPENA